MTDNILEAIQKLQDESLGNYTRANKAEQELRAARDLIARLESEVGQYQALEAGLRRRVDAAVVILRRHETMDSDGHGQTRRMCDALVALDAVRFALTASETEAQAPPAREQQADAERQANLRLRADLVEAVRELRAELSTVAAERDAARAELERVRGELSEAREIAARNARDCEHLRQSAIELTTERDAAREGERRVREKLGDLVEQWAHRPTAGPHEYGRRDGILSAVEVINAALTPPSEETCRGELERLRAELEQTKESEEFWRQGHIGLTAERDAARTALARLRAKVGPVVEWWRSYNPVLIDLRRIVPVLARWLDVLRSGWEDDPEPGGESNG